MGENTEIIEEELLIQDWYGDEWEEPSKVEFHLKKIDESNTEVILKHSNLPDDVEDDFEQGWKDYYMGPLKELLEE